MLKNYALLGIGCHPSGQVNFSTVLIFLLFYTAKYCQPILHSEFAFTKCCIIIYPTQEILYTWSNCKGEYVTHM